MRTAFRLPLLLAAGLSLYGATVDGCLEHRRYGRLPDALGCFSELIGSRDAYERAEGFWGHEDYKAANDQFRLAVEASPKNAHYRVRWGEMYIDYHQPADAAQLFQEALEIDEDNARAMLGIARVASSSFDKKAVEMAEAALKADSELVEARELIAFLALEDVDEERAAEEAGKALEMSDEALDAMAILATIDWLNDKEDSPWIERILKVNPIYGEAYATAGHFFVLNRRYEEGIEFYRKALELNPRLWDARTQLGVNLMRLGLEVEARQQLEHVFYKGVDSEATRNTLKLLDSYKNFVTFKTDDTVVRLDQKESELLRPYIESELLRCIRTYEEKYKIKLPGAVQLEVYPNHEDFAVRTMGMPGLGALGVTFGRVVAMDSPSGREPGHFHWASTLWHEMSHVFVLAATNHRVPRWFTEGVAVHEETAVSPEWGDRINSVIIDAIKEEKLLPIEKLDRGFIRPTYGGQVVVSYFQAGRICDYITERWGYDKLLDMMHAFAKKKTTPEVVREHLEMEPEAFDEEFLAWLDNQLGTVVDSFDDWKTRMKELMATAKNGKHDHVIENGPAVRDLFPQYVEAQSAYELIAESHLAQGDKQAAVAELERYMRIGGRSPRILKQLASLQRELGREEDATETLERINFIYPVNDEELHQQLGELYLAQGNVDAAVREYRAVVALNPIDQATAHYDLARAYKAADKTEEALKHVVMSLSVAHGFRPAQKMLLELSDSKKEN